MSTRPGATVRPVASRTSAPLVGLQLAGRGDLGHAAVLEQNVLGGIDAGGRIDEVATANHECRHARPPCWSAVSARSTTAMRMATPLCTCSRMADCGPSATPAVISRPRMMGPGCSTSGRGRERGQPLAGELVAGLVLVEIQLQAGEPLGLNAQHHDDLRLAEGGFEVALDGDAGAGAGRQFRQQLFGAAEHHARAQPGQQQHVGAGDAAVQDVADDGDGDAGEGVGGDGVDVRGADAARMVRRSSRAWVGCSCMPSPALSTGRRVDSSSSQAAPEELWRRMMASAPSARRVRPVSLSVSPFLDAGGEAGDQRGVGAEAFGGQFKAGAGARGGLVEQERDAALGEDAVADQRVHVLKSRGAGEDVADALQAQVLDGKQRTRMVRERRSGDWRRVKLAANGGCGCVHLISRFEPLSSVASSWRSWGARRLRDDLPQSTRSTSSTCSSLSTSWNLTSMISRLLVGTCLPT